MLTVNVAETKCSQVCELGDPLRWPDGVEGGAVVQEQ